MLHKHRHQHTHTHKHKHRHGKKHVREIIVALVSLVILLAIIFIPQLLNRNRGNVGMLGGKHPVFTPDRMLEDDELVPRYYFVYMAGYVSENARTDSIPDLSEDDPAWYMLMHSPLRLRDGKLSPNENITYTEAVVYLYDCVSTSEDISTLKFLADDPAMGWAYEHGFIELDERLMPIQNDKEITFSEALKMIYQAMEEGNVSFCDSVSDDVLARVFYNSSLFDCDYVAADSMTNGELAHAANRLRTEKIQTIFYSERADFTHKYADDLKAMEPALGTDRISAEFADKPASVCDALAMISYAMATKNHQSAVYGDIMGNYSDAPSNNQDMNKALSFAWRSGIRIHGSEIGNEIASKRDIANILLQYDMAYGLLSSVVVDAANITYADDSIKKFDLPVNAGLYQAVPESVPNAVADMAFRNTAGEYISLIVKPYENFIFCNDLRDEFARQLSTICAKIRSESGIGVKMTYYPQLVYDNRSGGEHLRVKVEITYVERGAALSDLLKYYESHIYPDNISLNTGTVFWADVHLDFEFFM